MSSSWAAGNEIELATWGAEYRESRIIYARLEEWNGFTEHAPRCVVCRHHNITYGPRQRRVRVTPVGELCLQCWLDWPACEVCGTGPVAVDEYVRGISLVFRGKKICAECLLVPEISPWEWDLQLLAFFAEPPSSYQRVFEAYPLTWRESCTILT